MTALEGGLLFPPFRLDLRPQQLWRGSEPVPLLHENLALLRYMVAHPGQVVTREELFRAVWPGTYVSDVVLTVCIRELRQALGDDARRPHFIEAIPRRGYRWIASLAVDSASNTMDQEKHTCRYWKRWGGCAVSLEANATSRYIAGWASGIEQIRQGVAAFRATGAEIFRPYFLALLAEAYGVAGQAEEGLAVLAEALEAVEKTGERFYEAELWRLKGELTLQKEAGGWRLALRPPKPQVSKEVEREAEGYFRKAIDIAQRQGAKSWELRVVMSLSRLWQRQGKKKYARKMLAEIYSWFTEGFDTADL